ncbi:MAG: GNAT family N-acetyltransferase [Bacteroidia bacterium]
MTKNGRLTLRPWQKTDLESLCEYANNAKIARFMTDRFPHPYGQKDGENFIAITTSSDNIDKFRVIEVGGEFAGGIGIHPKDDVFRLNAELAYWVAEPFWNRGIGTEAILQMVDYAFTRFEVSRIFASVYGSNLASQRVLLKAGFDLESKIPKSVIKNEEIDDCLIYSIRKGV